MSNCGEYNFNMFIILPAYFNRLCNITTWDKLVSESGASEFNPHLPSGPVHPYQLEEFISNFRGVWCTFFFFIPFRIDIPVSKQ